MVTIFPGWQNDTSTYYAENEVPQGDSALIRVPGGAGAITLDVYGGVGQKRYTVYATCSSYEDALEDKDSVVWHETAYVNVKQDLLAVLSACMGCYKIVAYEGNLTVKVRGK